METKFGYTEIIGYVASVVILISFLMKNMKALRIINSIGCFLFIIYGVLINNSIPIIFTNTAIVGINIYYLAKMRAEK